MFPLTRVPWWYRFFEPQPFDKGGDEEEQEAIAWSNGMLLGQHKLSPSHTIKAGVESSNLVGVCLQGFDKGGDEVEGEDETTRHAQHTAAT